MSEDAPDRASLNESGPWGNGAGGGDGGEGKPRGRKPSRRKAPVPNPSALDVLMSRGRAHFGGGGGGHHGLPTGPIARLVLLVVVALWLILTTAHTIDAKERGVVVRLGRYAGTLQPGLNMTFPWPIDRVHVLKVDTIQLDVDSSVEDATGGNGQNLVLTADASLIDLAYTVRWNIRDPELFLFELKDPQDTIREVAESAMREAVARVSFSQAISVDRGELGDRVAARMQEILDGYRAGVAIQGVAIRQADPPSEVMDAFKDVTAAQQEAQSYLNNARAYATQVNANASGEAIAFDSVYQQYKLAPEVTRRRMYYETMEKVLAKTDKTIVEAPGVAPYLPLQQAMPSLKAPPKAAGQ